MIQMLIWQRSIQMNTEIWFLTSKIQKKCFMLQMHGLTINLLLSQNKPIWTKKILQLPMMSQLESQVAPVKTKQALSKQTKSHKCKKRLISRAISSHNAKEIGWTWWSKKLKKTSKQLWKKSKSTWPAKKQVVKGPL